jgi:hypothetical protein
MSFLDRPSVRRRSGPSCTSGKRQRMGRSGHNRDGQPLKRSQGPIKLRSHPDNRRFDIEADHVLRRIGARTTPFGLSVRRCQLDSRSDPTGAGAALYTFTVIQKLAERPHGSRVSP